MIACLGALAGCNGKAERTEAKAPLTSDAPAQPGQVTFPPGSPKLSQIKVEAVGAASVPSEEVDSPGKVEANPNRMSHVVLPLAGRVAQVMVRMGDSVNQGDPVLSLESPDVDGALSAHLQSEASITQARASLTKAHADFDRVKDLFEHDAVAEKEVTNAQSVLTQSEAGLRQAEAASSHALRKLQILGIKPGEFGQKLTVRAPISGKVLELNVAPGEYRNDTNAQLMTIADLSSVWVSSDVQETSIRMVRMGERVEIELSAYPGEKFRGRVTQIADTVDPATRTIKVRAQLDNPGGRLRPEMFARIRLVAELKPKPVVPAAALVQGEGQTVVYREISRGVFQATPVKLGSRLNDKVAILSGLKGGERVVVDGVMLLKTY